RSPRGEERQSSSESAGRIADRPLKGSSRSVDGCRKATCLKAFTFLNPNKKSRKGRVDSPGVVCVVLVLEPPRGRGHDPVLDLRLAAVDALDRLRGEGYGLLDADVRTVPFHDRVERLVGRLADRERGAFERRAARIHLDELHS